MPEEKEINVSPIPVTVKDIAKHPLASITLVCLIGISGLYLRSEKIRSNMDDERKLSIRACIEKTDRLGTEVSFLQEQVRRSDSALASVTATLKVLEKYYKIQ